VHGLHAPFIMRIEESTSRLFNNMDFSLLALKEHQCISIEYGIESDEIIVMT
jgi:hypothetical protein